MAWVEGVRGVEGADAWAGHRGMTVGCTEEGVRGRHGALDVSVLDVGAGGVDNAETLQEEGFVVQGRRLLGDRMIANSMRVGAEIVKLEDSGSVLACADRTHVECHIIHFGWTAHGDLICCGSILGQAKPSQEDGYEETFEAHRDECRQHERLRCDRVSSLYVADITKMRLEDDCCLYNLAPRPQPRTAVSVLTQLEDLHKALSIVAESNMGSSCEVLVMA